MKRSIKRIGTMLGRLYRDEQGAEGLEKILIIGAIVLPLLAILIIYRNDLIEWLRGSWSDVKTDADTSPTFP